MNRSMVAKYEKAKKCAMQEISANAKAEMCCKTIAKNNRISVSNSMDTYDRFDTSKICHSRYAVQKRIDILVHGHCPINIFAENYPEVYEYVLTHGVPETRQYFSRHYFNDINQL